MYVQTSNLKAMDTVALQAGLLKIRAERHHTERMCYLSLGFTAEFDVQLRPSGRRHMGHPTFLQTLQLPPSGGMCTR
jgi:hypothetical protein